MTAEGPFDNIAEEYDHWYDTVEGAAIFAAEFACLRMVVPQMRGSWLEIGSGTGRFGCALGVAEGIDPSHSMLEIAAARGIQTKVGTAEKLPYPADCFDGALMVTVLCFVENMPGAFDECSRVIRPGGTLLIGHIPADGPWGQDYIGKAAAGHPVYSRAHFHHGRRHPYTGIRRWFRNGCCRIGAFQATGQSSRSPSACPARHSSRRRIRRPRAAPCHPGAIQCG